MFVPDDTELLELSPQPVPPTAIVPASPTLITTSGVASLVGVVTAVLSVAAVTLVSAPTTALHASAWIPRPTAAEPMPLCALCLPSKQAMLRKQAKVMKLSTDCLMMPHELLMPICMMYRRPHTCPHTLPCTCCTHKYSLPRHARQAIRILREKKTAT